MLVKLRSINSVFMNFELISFLVGLMIIPFAVMFVHKVMFNNKYVIHSFSLVIIFAIIGLTKINYQTSGKPNFYLFLFCPLCSLILFRIFLFFFRVGLHRNPKATMQLSRWSLHDNEGWDKLFYFTFMTISLCTPVLILSHFYP